MDLTNNINNKSEGKMKDLIQEAIKDKGLNLSDYSEAYEITEALDYDGRLHEIIDGAINIYHYEIRKWAVDNWEYVEQAIEEGLCEGITDYHKIIQSGQFVYYTEQANKTIEEIFSEFTDSLIEKEV